MTHAYVAIVPACVKVGPVKMAVYHKYLILILLVLSSEGEPDIINVSVRIQVYSK